MNLTPEDYKKAMANAVKVVETNVGKIMLNGANLGSGLMQRRVFNKGVATSGKKMMYRSAPYKRLRVDAKLQIAHKDLTFTGNLFNSLTILGSNNKEVNYGFNNSEMAEIAEFQETGEHQVKEPIFKLSKKEIQQVEKAMTKDVLRIVVATFESYPNVPSVSPLKEDAVNKSIRRNTDKKKRDKIRKQKENAKKRIGREPRQRQLSEIQKREATIAKGKQAKSELKSNQFARKNIQSQTEKLNTYISTRQAKLNEIGVKLAKTKTGSKKGKELSARMIKLKTEVSSARQKLSQVGKVSQLKSQIASASKAQSGLRTMKRVDRAKKMRQGVYKPKKRKKS
jgi:hypothetical protein